MDNMLYRQNVIGQDGMDKMVLTKWYGQHAIQTKCYWTRWYGKNGTDRILAYGQKGSNFRNRL